MRFTFPTYIPGLDRARHFLDHVGRFFLGQLDEAIIEHASLTFKNVQLSDQPLGAKPYCR